MSEYTQRKRADSFKAKFTAATHELAAARKQIRLQFARGSAETMAAVYAAMPTDEVAVWIGQRLLASRSRKPPFKLSPEAEESAVRETAAILARCGLDEYGPTDIVEMFRGVGDMKEPTP